MASITIDGKVFEVDEKIISCRSVFPMLWICRISVGTQAWGQLALVDSVRLLVCQ